MKPDPIELELFRHLLVSIAEEMGAVLRKTSYSANIKERRDYSCAVYDAQGETVAMGDHMPVHLGAMPLSVQHAMAAFDFGPGDVAILNDPFALTPGFSGPKQPKGNKPAFEADLQSWTAPFMMALINTRNVHRSNMLMGFPYGKQFVYEEP